MFHDGHLLLVLHAPPKPEDDERHGRYFWRKPDGTWSSTELGSGPGALARHLAEYADRIEQLDEQEELAHTAHANFAVIDALVPLQRAAKHLHHVLQEARTHCPEDRDLINFRDQAYELERRAELMHQAAKNSLEFAIAKRSEEQAAAGHAMTIAAHRLNILAAFFFPLATLSAVFGVNLIHGWEDAPGPVPFLVLTGVGLVCGAILATFVRKSQ
jgi:Mg2+ and Co2+ transporter CorA